MPTELVNRYESLVKIEEGTLAPSGVEQRFESVSVDAQQVGSGASK
jgi:hypothetical protein